MSTKRKAVTIILTQDPDSSEIYLVKRNPNLKFFGGYYAFPGGTLDDEDMDFEIKNSDLIPKESQPYLVAAARELFEETGIFVPKSEQKISQQLLKKYRRELLANEIQFYEILKKEDCRIDAADFNFVCSILTPEFSPVRYDTEFYWIELSKESVPEILPGELTHGKYFTAEEALSQWNRGEMLIVPPVVYMLRELQNKSLKQAVPEIRKHAEEYRNGFIHEVYFTPGVQLLTLKTRTLPPATSTNTFIVGERHLYIIDPAPSDSSEQNRLWNYFDVLIAQGRTLQAILLTHHHSDHIGAVKECQKRYDLPLMAHEKTAQKLPDFQIKNFLKHGDELDLGKSPDGKSGWKLKIFHTPGHASGHLCFQENRYNAVIAGDMISTLSTIVIAPPDGQMATYMRSLELLLSVTTGTIYPSHGPAVRDGQRILQYFIQHRKEREQKLLEALSERPGSLSELVAKVYNDVDSSIWPLAEQSLYAALEKLIEEGRCAEIEGRYVNRI